MPKTELPAIQCCSSGTAMPIGVARAISRRLTTASALFDLFLNPHLMTRPDRGNPAFDSVGFTGLVLRGLLSQR